MGNCNLTSRFEESQRRRRDSRSAARCDSRAEAPSFSTSRSGPQLLYTHVPGPRVLEFHVRGFSSSHLTFRGHSFFGFTFRPPPNSLANGPRDVLPATHWLSLSPPEPISACVRGSNRRRKHGRCCDGGARGFVSRLPLPVPRRHTHGVNTKDDRRRLLAVWKIHSKVSSPQGEDASVSAQHSALQPLRMSKATKRKHVVKEVLEEFAAPMGQQQIVKVLGTPGNNLHEVETAVGENFLVTMPTKYRKNIWIKRGDFVMVEPIEEGDKVKAEIVSILNRDHMRYLKKEGVWPAKFGEHAGLEASSNKNVLEPKPNSKGTNCTLNNEDVSDEDESEDDDLFVNTNHVNVEYPVSTDEDDSEESDVDDNDVNMSSVEKNSQQAESEEEEPEQ